MPVPDPRLNCQYSKKTFTETQIYLSNCVIRFSFLKYDNSFNHCPLALLSRANKRNDGSVRTIRQLFATHLLIERCNLKLSLYSPTLFMNIVRLYTNHTFCKTPYIFAQNMFTKLTAFFRLHTAKQLISSSALCNLVN